MDREEIRDIIARLIDEDGIVEVLNAVWHYLDREAATIRHDVPREPHIRAMKLLEEAVELFEE